MTSPFHYAKEIVTGTCWPSHNSLSTAAPFPMGLTPTTLGTMTLSTFLMALWTGWDITTSSKPSSSSKELRKENVLDTLT
jgi:hypothetical protein